MLFAGLAFILMGVGLAADAKGHAAAAAHWLSPETSRGLTAAYRLGGLAFIALGALLPFIPFDTTRLGPWAGAGFLGIAVWLALAKRPEWGQRPLPRGLEAAPAREPWGPRLARWSGWGVAACFAAFGLVLLLQR